MVEVTALTKPELRLLEEHIASDARWVGWLARRIRIDGPTARPAPLHAGGTLDPHPPAATLRLATALQDLRRRRMSPDAPAGWPILSLSQRSALVRAEHAAFRGHLVVEGPEAVELGRILHLAGDLARMEWAMAALDRESCGARPRRPCPWSGVLAEHG